MTMAPAAPTSAKLVVVTGAGGFVGSQVALELAAAGFEVLATDQHFDVATTTRLAALLRIEAPLAAALDQAAGLQPFAVIHGAAITAGPASFGVTPARDVRLNTDMLTLCLDWARSVAAARFIFLSSTAVFAAGDGAGSVTETSAATARGPYSAAKKAGEILTQGAADAGFATLSLRLGSMYGPYEAARPTRPGIGLMARMFAGAQAGLIRVETPHARRDWTWLPDIGRAIAALLHDFPGETIDVLHCGNTEQISDLALAQLICAHFPGAKVETDPPPYPVSKAPMGRSIRSVLTEFDWTPLDQALPLMLKTDRPANR